MSYFRHWSDEKRSTKWDESSLESRAVSYLKYYICNVLVPPSFHQLFGLFSLFLHKYDAHQLKHQTRVFVSAVGPLLHFLFSLPCTKNTNVTAAAFWKDQLDASLALLKATYGAFPNRSAGSTWLSTSAHWKGIYISTSTGLLGLQLMGELVLIGATTQSEKIWYELPSWLHLMLKHGRRR